MKKRLIIVSALAVFLFVLLSISPDVPAQDPPTAEAPTQSTPAIEPPDTEPLETFKPTEKLSADSAVSFPVDI